MVILVLYLVLSIVFSLLCSILEAVLLSITPSYIKRKQTDDPEIGHLIANLKKDIDKPLSAILSLNTIAHTVGAIGVGAQATIIYGTAYFSLFGLQVGYTSVVATAMTLAILFLSEIIPKTIGANNWKTLAPITARSLRILMIVLKPFVWISNLITRMLKKDKNKSVFSRRDFAAMTDMVGESGQIHKSDHTLIKNVLAFDDLTAEDIMTPRTVMVTAEESQTLREFFDEHKSFRFSRIPIYQDNKDHVTGLVLKDELLQHIIDGKENLALRDIKRDVPVVVESMSLRKLFTKMNENRDHLSIVVDEYGGVQGLVSLEDVFETLLGLEIIDETDSISDLQQYARNQWKERARKLGLIE